MKSTFIVSSKRKKKKTHISNFIIGKIKKKNVFIKKIYSYIFLGYTIMV